MQICCHAEVSTVFLMLVEPNPSDVLRYLFKPACRAKEVALVPTEFLQVLLVSKTS